MGMARQFLKSSRRIGANKLFYASAERQVMKIATIAGARPQFIKMKPLSKAIRAHNELYGSSKGAIMEVCVHTGQHYDYQMSQVFFDGLELRLPDYHLGVGSGSHGCQTADMLRKIEEVLQQESPDVVVVFGDTNSTLAGALAAAKLHIPVAHIEAGLRSFNRNMPEEINRVLTDHMARYLFAPTATAVRNLNAEGITHGVSLVGDVMYEAAMEYAEIARKESRILERLGLKPKEFCLATLHRSENTDDPACLRRVVEAFREISKHEDVVWPVHPRSRKRLRELGIDLDGCKGLLRIEPVSYFDMLKLEASARVVLTDSGGVQKEARWLRVPCVTLRAETEWTETIEEGWNHLVGSGTEEIIAGFRAAASRTQNEVVSPCNEPPAASVAIVRALMGSTGKVD